ncbi:MAG: hypothetical protein HUU37_10070, partial [Bdellovibrionales bacterium]|nr:hypothetical protein [Bdellovibrionales bacterium]
MEKKSSRFWMSLEQAESPETFDAGGEFRSTPVREGYEAEGLGRRDFMKVMGASALMASLAGCTRRPVQKIVPYVAKPEEVTSGVPNFYASACPRTGYGLLVTAREGRPIKVDGNGDHPLNRGGLDARGLASVHDLYDPDRLRGPVVKGASSTWEAFLASARESVKEGGVAFLTGTVLSPTVQGLLDKTGARHVMVDSVPMDDVLDAQADSYGSRVFPRYRFDKADYVLSIDADFLGTWGSTVEYTKQFAGKRRLEGNRSTMGKLVVFESAPTLTGYNADERHAIHPSDQLHVALALAREVARATGRGTADLDPFGMQDIANRTGVPAAALERVADELLKFRGRGLVVASGKGAHARALQNVVNFLNSALGNEGETVDGTPSYQFKGSYADLEKLVNAMKQGAVKTLVIHGVNPMYSFPKTVGFEEALSKVAHVIYVGTHLDETARKAELVAAESSPFEAWGDVNPAKDVYSIVQPTIRPIWNTKSFLELLLDLAPAFGASVAESAHEQVRNTWRTLHGRYSTGFGFEAFWDDCLQTGVLEAAAKRIAGDGSARAYRGDAIRSSVAAVRGLPPKSDFALVLSESVALGDGSQA